MLTVAWSRAKSLCSAIAYFDRDSAT